MSEFITELSNCSRTEALCLIKAILYYYSSLFEQSLDDTLEELKNK